MSRHSIEGLQGQIYNSRMITSLKLDVQLKISMDRFSHADYGPVQSYNK